MTWGRVFLPSVGEGVLYFTTTKAGQDDRVLIRDGGFLGLLKRWRLKTGLTNKLSRMSFSKYAVFHEGLGDSRFGPSYVQKPHPPPRRSNIAPPNFAVGSLCDADGALAEFRIRSLISRTRKSPACEVLSTSSLALATRLVALRYHAARSLYRFFLSSW